VSFRDGSKHPLEVTVQRSHDADGREHRWIVVSCDRQKRRIAACRSASCSAVVFCHHVLLG